MRGQIQGWVRAHLGLSRQHRNHRYNLHHKHSLNPSRSLSPNHNLRRSQSRSSRVKNCRLNIQTLRKGFEHDDGLVSAGNDGFGYRDKLLLLIEDTEARRTRLTGIQFGGRAWRIL